MIKKKNKFKENNFEFKEIFFNNSKIKNLYNIYLKQTLFDKILDYLVFFAICFTFFEVISHLFFHFSNFELNILHKLSIFVLFVFILELFREYSISLSTRDFFKKHWLDFFLVAFLSVYFLSATYFGFARFKFLVNLKNYVKETKHIKIILNFLGGHK